MDTWLVARGNKKPERRKGVQGHMIVALGGDHGGYDLKQEVIGYLKEKEIEYRDFGCESRESCDYP